MILSLLSMIFTVCPAMDISGSPFRNMADIAVFSILFLEDAGMNEPLPAS